jgi:DtxR family Mn-dependent transcriptional regulator
VTTRKTAPLSRSLEDYLETIYELVRDHKVARVKDIAGARGVKPGSVSPAMRRLADAGLIRYEQREYIDLTPRGERLARRVLARHNLLTRFFSEILLMDADEAEADACAMEHNLSDEGMDRLTRLFEFFKTCPEKDRRVLERFQQSPGIGTRGAASGGEITLADLEPGESGVVSKVRARGALRTRLLDMGILPDVEIEVTRVDPSRRRHHIQLQGFDISLEQREARAVLIRD